MHAFSKPAEMLRQAVLVLWRHKLRSVLTMFGIGWGVCALALITATGEGFRQGQRKNWEQLGDRIVMVFGGRTEMQAGGQKAGRRILLFDSDVEAIRGQCPLVDVAAAEVKNYDVPVASSYNAGRFLTLGVDPEYLKIRNLPVSIGRTISSADVEQKVRVCVLGDSVRKQLFEDRKDIIGERLQINGHPYQIVGVMGEKNQNSSYDGWDNDKVLIPASALRRDCPPSRAMAVEGRVEVIVYRPRSVLVWEATQDQVRRTLGRIHDFDPRDEAALPMWDTVQTAAMFDDIFYSLGIFLGSVAFVTLSLGGMGVMNTMMTSVIERTSEIGLRKAVGATRNRILAEFFLEGLLLAMISGTGGLVLVGLLATLVNALPMPDFFSGLPVDGFLVLKVAAALGVVGVVSALPPAWKAAGMTPVQALSFEK